jgi:hypothetical protein
MTDPLSAVPQHHRGPLRRALGALRELQGRGATPGEYRIVELRAGLYEMRFFAFPLGITADHMRAAERMPHVTHVEVNFSLAGSTPDVHGALCVRIDLAGGKRRVIDDELEEDDAASKRRTLASQASQNTPSWIARLWSGGV